MSIICTSVIYFYREICSRDKDFEREFGRKMITLVDNEQGYRQEDSQRNNANGSLVRSQGL